MSKPNLEKSLRDLVFGSFFVGLGTGAAITSLVNEDYLLAFFLSTFTTVNVIIAYGDTRDVIKCYRNKVDGLKEYLPSAQNPSKH